MQEIGPRLHVGHRIHRTARAMVRYLDRRLSKFGVTRSQYLILRELASGDVLTLREIAARVDVADPSTLQTLDLLQERGFVTRERSTRDQRKVLFTITPRGRALYVKAQKEHDAVNAVLYRGLSDTELRVMRGFFERIQDNIDDVLRTDPES